MNAKNVVGNTPLHYAAGYGHTDTAKMLIDNGADVNIKNISGKTPLDLAKEHGHSEVVDLLRKHGAK